MKLVYAGAPGAGKASNLRYAHSQLDETLRTPISQPNASIDEILSFSYRPPQPQLLPGVQTCFQVYTLSGRCHCTASWELLLRSVDGIILVIDSTLGARVANSEALDKINQLLSHAGQVSESLPTVIQYNKRDQSELEGLSTLNRMYNLNDFPAIEAIANQGRGVIECLHILTSLIMDRFNETTDPVLLTPHLFSRPSSLW